MTKKLEEILRHIPGFAAAQQAIKDEAISHRTTLIAKVREQRARAAKAEADVAPVVTTLEARAAKLRQQLAAVEAELSANLAASASTRWAADNAVRDLQDQLRADAGVQVREFQASIEQTREMLQWNLGYARDWLLGGDSGYPVNNKSVVAALALLLEVHREAGRVAAEEADPAGSITGLRERLTKAGVRLVDSKMLLNLVPPPAKEAAYL